MEKLKVYPIELRATRINTPLAKADSNYDLYFVSEREINKDDWFCYKHFGEWVGPIRFIGDSEINNKENINRRPRFYFKVEATTDTDIGLPAISKSFVEKWVQQGKIEHVYIELQACCIEAGYNCICEHKGESNWAGQYLIRTNPAKQVIIIPLKDSWNREEVIQIIENAVAESIPRENLSVREWFNQNY